MYKEKLNYTLWEIFHVCEVIEFGFEKCEPSDLKIKF
jgi:hypothetical protein